MNRALRLHTQTSSWRKTGSRYSRRQHRLQIVPTDTVSSGSGKRTIGQRSRPHRRRNMQRWPGLRERREAQAGPGLADPANLGNSPGRWQQRSMKESRCTGYALPPSTEWHRSRFHSSLSPLKCSRASPRATRWFVDALRGSRIVGELGQRPPWACDELTTAVWACAAENGRRASLAKRAFERADASFRGVGRKVLVAALAVWSQLKHGVLPEVGICGSGSPCMDEATTTERPILPGRFLEANHDVFAIEPLLRQGSHMARLASR